MCFLTSLVSVCQYSQIDLSRLIYVWGQKIARCTIVWTRLNTVPGVLGPGPGVGSSSSPVLRYTTTQLMLVHRSTVLRYTTTQLMLVHRSTVLAVQCSCEQIRICYHLLNNYDSLIQYNTIQYDVTTVVNFFYLYCEL
jgi:hypothetical protein